MALESKHFWMSLPVMLLLMSLSIGVTAVVVSSRNHGTEVERDAYRRGLQWDEHQKAIAASKNLGWQVAVRPDGVEALGQPIDVFFDLSDGRGEPVPGATGTVRAIHNADARTVFEGPLVETVPGTYRFSLAPHRGGIWRWEVVFEDGEVMFVDELRAELFGVAHSAQAEPAQAAEPGGGEG